MKSFTLRAVVSLSLLALGGVLTFSDVPEAVSRKGHQVLWLAEAAWLLWELNTKRSGPRPDHHNSAVRDRLRLAKVLHGKAFRRGQVP
jgi:hypothetical protein